MSRCERAQQQQQQQQQRGSILYSILKRGRPGTRLCACAPRARLLAPRAPAAARHAASRVLAKTVRFVKSVPCFRGLSARDQVRLVRHSWAPMLVLGLAQDAVDLEVVEVVEEEARRPSLLRSILTCSSSSSSSSEARGPGVDVRAAEGILAFLVRGRGLRISVKEYAFLRGALLFSPEVEELEYRDYIRALHGEAERALQEHVGAPRGRLGRLRALLGALRSVDPEAVAGLFFGPGIAGSSVDEHVVAMFHEP